MGKRKRSGLGASDADHSRHGEAAAQRVREVAHRVYRDIEDGACASAMKHLLDATHDAGEAIAHSKSGGSIPSMTGAMDDVIGVREIFERRCKFNKAKRR
jgi:hypothetical protein